MKTRHCILLLAWAASQAGCNKTSDKASPAPTAPASKGSAAVHKPASNASTNPLPVLPPALARSAKKVQGERTGAAGMEAVAAMRELINGWSPVGRDINEVKSVFGKPSEENGNQLIYRFDNGDQAYEWTMPKTGNTIASVSLVLYE